MSHKFENSSALNKLENVVATDQQEAAVTAFSVSIIGKRVLQTLFPIVQMCDKGPGNA